MLTRPKVRRAVCWVGILIGAAALAGYLLCLWRPLVIGSNERVLVLGRGAVGFYWASNAPGGWNPGMFVGRDPGVGGPGWWRRIPKWQEPDSPGRTNPSRAMGEFVVPLWMPLAFGLLCAYWLLPERGPWHVCVKCGYDLQGVPRKEGKLVCPECGEAGA